MDTENILTLIVATYGALLSTVLGIRELFKEKRQVAIFLEHQQWSGTFSIIISNIGHRAITLVDLSMVLPDPDGQVPRGLLREMGDPFPVTLNDGQHLNLKLSSHMSSFINPFQAKKIKIIVYDAEGNKYSDFKVLFHDEKSGSHNTKFP